MTITIITTAGAMKYGSIWQIFANAIKVKAGPYKKSLIGKESELSRILKSFENLLISIPEGVVSKKSHGLRTIPLIMF